MNFDYEAKIWGGSKVQPRPFYIQGLKLHYCLESIGSETESICDIGCGGGNMAKAMALANPEVQVFGVDVSAASIAQAQLHPDGVTFHLSDADTLPFADNSLGMVTMFDVLEHVKDPEKVLREVRRVLRPGGIFHIALPLEDQPWTLYRVMTRHGWGAKKRHCGHIQFFSAESFTRLATSCGLSTRRVRWSFQPLFMFIDVAYFVFRDWYGPASSSIEDYISAQSGLRAKLLALTKSLVSSIGWYESRFFSFLPAGTGHFTCTAV